MRGMEAGLTPGDMDFATIAGAKDLLGEQAVAYEPTDAPTSAGVVFEWDMVTDQIRWANGFKELTGYALDPRTALSHWWKDQIHREDAGRRQKRFEAALRSSSSNYCLDYRFCHKDSRWLHLREHGVVERHQSGWPLRITGFVSDLTPLKDAQEHLAQAHKLLERITTATPDLLFLYDLNTERNLYANREMGRVLGYSSSEMTALGSAFVPRIMHPDDLADFQAFRARVDTLDDGEVFEHEYRVRDATGSYRWLRAREVVFARSSDGRPSHVVGLAQDITEHKEREVRLKASEKALRETDHRKDEFLAMLSHELRNPLAPITTALQVMKSRGVKVIEKERQVIDRQVRYLERLIQDLLDVSRVTQGKIELRKETLELSEVITRSVEVTLPVFRKKRQRLQVDVAAKGLPIFVDPVRFSQVVINVLTNAAKYTPAGGRIFVAAGLQGAEAVVRISDSGNGMTPELVNKVFELFVQGPRTLDRSQGGLGLGLPIARRIVEMHGGHISAASEGLGKGSTFVVSVPLAVKPKRRSRAKRSVEEQQELTLDREVSRRILVVDDNRDAAEMLAEALQSCGHTLDLAFDGQDVAAHVHNFAPEVILMDIGLPTIDGYQVARALRADPAVPKSLKLVAVTGYGHEEDRQRALQAGFDHHLVKPVDLDQIYRLIRA